MTGALAILFLMLTNTFEAALDRKFALLWAIGYWGHDGIKPLNKSITESCEPVETFDISIVLGSGHSSMV